MFLEVLRLVKKFNPILQTITNIKMAFEAESLVRVSSFVDNNKSPAPPDFKTKFRKAKLQISVTDVRSVNVYITSLSLA
jgi:hypothetical protein